MLILIALNQLTISAVKTGWLLACSAILLCDSSALARVQPHLLLIITLSAKHKANSTSDVSLLKTLFGVKLQ